MRCTGRASKIVSKLNNLGTPVAAPKNPVGSKSEKPWRDAIQRAVKRRSEGKGQPQELERLADAIVKAGLAGDIQALKEIGDRLDGKPVQQNTHSGEDGSPIAHTFRWLNAEKS